MAVQESREMRKKMANLYYGNITGLSDGDIKTISSSKPADKLVLFGNGEINFDELTALNEAAAKIEFVKAESEAAMYFILGANTASAAKGTKVMFLSNIDVPNQFAGLAGISVMGSAAKKKTVRKSRNKAKVETETETAQAEKAEPEADTVEEVKPAETKPKAEEVFPMPEPVKDNSDDDIWITESAKTCFVEQCGLPEALMGRNQIAESVAKIIYKNNSLNEAMDEIKVNYAPSIAAAIGEHINDVSIYINNGAVKGKYEK